jgi:hypothetical protein
VPPGPTCRRPITALPLSLSLSHPSHYHRAPPRPGPACQSRLHPVAHTRRPPLFPRQWRHPRSTVGGHCRSPRAAHCSARAPLSSFSLLHADAPAGPPFPLPFARATEPPSKQNASHCSCPISPCSPLIHARATRAERRLLEPMFPVALPSTGAPSFVGIWPAPPLSSLSSVRHP